MLTKQQAELLAFIAESTTDKGVSPTFDEMRKALGLRSKSSIHLLIGALEERGFISRTKNRSRAIQVLRLPGKNGALTPSVASIDYDRGYRDGLAAARLGSDLLQKRFAP